MRIKLILLSLFCLLGSSLFFATPVSAAVDCGATNLTPVEQVKCGVQATNPNVADEDSEQTIYDIIATIINVLSIIVGIISVIVIIIQGLRLIVSGSSKDAAKEVRNGIIYALVGLTIVALAQVIVNFVLNKLQ